MYSLFYKNNEIENESRRWVCVGQVSISFQVLFVRRAPSVRIKYTLSNAGGCSSYPAQLPCFVHQRCFSEYVAATYGTTCVCVRVRARDDEEVDVPLSGSADRPGLASEWLWNIAWKPWVSIFRNTCMFFMRRARDWVSVQCSRVVVFLVALASLAKHLQCQQARQPLGCQSLQNDLSNSSLWW